MTIQSKMESDVGYERHAYLALVQDLIDRMGTAPQPPAALLAELTGRQVRDLVQGLEWCLVGEAVGDDFLRYLFRSRRGLLDLEGLPAAEAAAVRAEGLGAASLTTLVTASTTPDWFVELLAAVEDSPYWEDRAQELYETVADAAWREPAASNGRAPVETGDSGAGTDTVQMLRNERPRGGPPAPSAAFWFRVVEVQIHQLLTGPDREAFQSGLADVEPQSRHELARRALTKMGNPDQESKRAYYTAAAAAIRSVLRGWARAQTDGLPVKPTPWIEMANGESLVYPRMDESRGCDWDAAAAEYDAAAVANPETAEAFDLHLYAGISYPSIDKLLGLEPGDAERRCQPLIDQVLGTRPAAK